MQLKKIRNFTATAQSVIVDGNQVVLDGNTERFFPSDIANLFLAECGAFVKEVVVAAVKETATDERIYLANMTGNPDAPASVGVKFPQKSQYGMGWGLRDEANPVKAARELKYVMKGAQVEFQGQDGLEGQNTFPTTYKIPPYTRVPFPPHIANWIMSRDARNEPHYRGQVMQSRYVAFAPDSDWDLDDLRLFLKQCDPKAQLGPSEAQVNADNQGADEETLLIKIYEAKEVALQRIHFQISNPQVNLPTPKTFEQFKARELGLPMPEVKRGPGRPRKDANQPAA